MSDVDYGEIAIKIFHENFPVGSVVRIRPRIERAGTTNPDTYGKIIKGEDYPDYEGWSFIVEGFYESQPSCAKINELGAEPGYYWAPLAWLRKETADERAQRLGISVKGSVMKREEVYRLIDGERDYQNKVWVDSGANEVGSHCALIERYARKGLDAWTDNKGDEAGLDVIRKIAALCVRAMEQHGAPVRKVVFSPPSELA